MSLRNAIKDKLKILKEEYGVLSIKAEFEAEGTRKDELIILREFVYEANLGMIIKIGGCEAVRDLEECKLLDATGVMAPMIETPFAMQKFKKAFVKVFGESAKLERIINAETKTCLQYFDEILHEGKGFLTGITVGRSDLSASMGIDRADIESSPIFAATSLFMQRARRDGLVCNFGGNIGAQSVPFIQKIHPLADRFETRKVVMPAGTDEIRLKKTIYHAIEFEKEYLQFKAEYYNLMANEDSERILRLENQLELLKG